MKTIKIGLTVMAAALAIALFSGCAGVRDYFYTPTTTVSAPVTNTVPVFDPVDVVAEAKTNFTTGVITPPVAKPGAIPIGFQPVIIQPSPVTQWEPGPNATAAQTVVGVIPGYGGLAGSALLAALSLGKLYLNRKNVPIITTTFKTIEDWANAAIASGDPKATALAIKLKEQLAAAHDYADVLPQVQQLLDAATGHSGNAAKVAEIARKP